MERTNLGFMVNQQLYWWDNTKESQSFRTHGREPQSSSECLMKWCIHSSNSAWVSEVHLRTPRSAFISLWTPSLQPVHRDHLLWMNMPLNSAKQVLHNMVVRYCIIWTKLLPLLTSDFLPTIVISVQWNQGLLRNTENHTNENH